MADRSGAKSFNSAQIQKILQRAAVSSSAEAGALTLDELAEVARDVGISRRDLERAIAEADEPEPVPRGPLDLLFGAPRQIAFERRLPHGVEVERLESLRADIEHSLGQPGRAWGTATSWTWSSYAMPGATQVSIVNGQGSATLRIDARFRGLAGALFGGVGIGGANAFGWPLFGILLFFGSPFIAIGAGLTAAALAYGLARWIYSDVVNKRARKLEALLGTLSDRLG